MEDFAAEAVAVGEAFVARDAACFLGVAAEPAGDEAGAVDEGGGSWARKVTRKSPIGPEAMPPGCLDSAKSRAH